MSSYVTKPPMLKREYSKRKGPLDHCLISFQLSSLLLGHVQPVELLIAYVVFLYFFLISLV